VVDAVQRALDLKPEALSYSRDVLRTYGNMSSATVMFVLASMIVLRLGAPPAAPCRSVRAWSRKR
jgi:predicted naringenin-chalcone synthase